MDEINAKGVKGFILYSSSKQRHYFRTYKEDGTFLNYDLNCEELAVTIDSDNCSLYNVDGKLKLDFSSGVLGK